MRRPIRNRGVTISCVPRGAIAAAGNVSRSGDLGLGPIVGADAQYGFVLMLAP
jgi:hypothetical protein